MSSQHRPPTPPQSIIKDTPLKKINNIEELLKPNSDVNFSKRVNFKLDDIVSKEYSGEKRVNDSLKLSKIFELLGDINKKQDTILGLLKPEETLLVE